MDNNTSILGFAPNSDQVQAIDKLIKFINSDSDIFILKGSAGTGKTSIVKCITSYLFKNDICFNIGAPTGRAAKIIGDKTQCNARTMHSQIYTPEKIKGGGGVLLKRKTNKQTHFSVFLVDEASMVSNVLSKSESFFVQKPLLEDFISYVKQGNENNKIIFIGDSFQLPPVNEDFSPALSQKYLQDTFSLSYEFYELKKVMRQGDGSSILSMATDLRALMAQGVNRAEVDIHRERNTSEALRRYLSLYSSDSMDNITAICSSNRDVDYWNGMIRRSLGLSQNLLSSQDLVVTQGTWLNNSGDWVYKGEYGKIINVDSIIERYADLNFVNAEIEFLQNDGNSKIITTKVLLDSFQTNYGFLSPEKEKYLYAQAMKHNPDFRQTENFADDKYMGAIRLKHAYAITCHKAQGGEWQNVLIHPWLIGKDLQWTYTAITRGKMNVFSYAA